MNRSFAFLILFAATFLLSDSIASAQPPGGGRPGGGRPGQGGERQGGQRGGRGPGMGGLGMGGPGAQQQSPLLRVFDANGDGELSASEIDAAASALRKMDQNQDGKLTATELRPSGGPQGQAGPGRGGEQRAGGRGPGGGNRPGGAMVPGGGNGPGGREGAGGGRGPGGGNGPGGSKGPGGSEGPGGRDSGRSDSAFADEILAFDDDKNGLLSESELPDHMHAAFAIADANHDGTLDAKERVVLASQFSRRNLQPGSDNLEMKNRPTGGRRP